MRAIIATAVVALGIGAGSTTAAADPVHEIHVEARKFTFEPSIIEVTAGEHVRVILRSADGPHGFAIRDLKIDQSIPRGGELATIEFVAPPPGRYDITCSEFCGIGHAHMRAAIVSVAPSRPTR